MRRPSSRAWNPTTGTAFILLTLTLVYQLVQAQSGSSPFQITTPAAKYSLSLFNHFCPVKRNGKYFAKKWSEQKVLVIEVVGLYSTYQKYKRIGVPSSYQFGENWT